MKAFKWVLKRSGMLSSFAILMVAQLAANQYSLWYYQDKIPEKLRKK